MSPNIESEFPVVSTVVRFHDCAQLGKLTRAIQSLHAQINTHVQPIIVTQRFNSSELAAVSNMVAEQWFFDWHLPSIVLNLDDSGTSDARSRLLNMGIQAHIQSGNKYLAFLDYDDILYTHAYKTLYAPLIGTPAAISFAGMEMARAVGLADYDFVYEVSRPFIGKNKLALLQDNFAPLHSYLIDTAKIPKEKLSFNESLVRLEDYDFLLRVAGAYPCSFSQMDVIIGAYLMRGDGMSSTPSHTGSETDLAQRAIWKENKALLDRYRSQYPVHFFASDF